MQRGLSAIAEHPVINTPQSAAAQWMGHQMYSVGSDIGKGFTYMYNWLLYEIRHIYVFFALIQINYTSLKIPSIGLQQIKVFS